MDVKRRTLALFSGHWPQHPVTTDACLPQRTHSHIGEPVQLEHEYVFDQQVRW